MVDQTSYMFITGPDVIKTVTGEDVSFEELGGGRTHNTKSRRRALPRQRRQGLPGAGRALLSYLPSNNLDDAPAYDEEDLDALEPETFLDTFIPDSSNQPYDIKTVIEHVVDDGEFLEVQALFAPNIVCGFARVDGRSVGVVANQPMSFAGTPRHRRVREGRAFRAHLRRVQHPDPDVRRRPGFLPGTSQEWNGIIRRGAKLLYAYAEATVPKVTVITRKAYGGAYDVMGSKHVRADINLAWPTAEIAVMGAQGAANILHRRELADADDPERARKELVDDYESHFANPYIAAERGYVDAVITPSQTRHEVIRALRLLRNKRESLPPKKHGNIPL